MGWLCSAAVAGDPNDWAGVCRSVDTVRSAVRSRGVRLVVVLVQTPEGDGISEERITSLTRQAGIERKFEPSCSSCSFNEPFFFSPSQKSCTLYTNQCL